MSHHLDSEERVIVQPDEGILPVVGLIGTARSSLQIKQFSLTSPEIVQAIIDAHRRGTAVRIMLNPKNTAGTPENDATFATLQQAGVSVQWTAPGFLVTHEKSVLVDGERVLIHTFNLGAKYFSETRDVGLICTHPTTIAEVEECFAADWERRPFVPQAADLLWGPVNGRVKLAQFIDSAKHRLHIFHPRYVDTTILERILAAQARGVRVHVLCGGKHGVKEWDLLDTLSSLRILRDAGVKVRRLKQLKVHIKLLVADGERAVIGSMNIHRSAFDLRRELATVVSGAGAVRRLQQVFDADWDRAHDYDPPDPLKPETHPQDDLPDDPHFVHD